MLKRTALARAMARGGDLILLDEPFSSLDEGLTLRMIQMIQEEWGDRTLILVTHSTREAEAFSPGRYIHIPLL